ncbi:integral peroxisomal membrane peroxin-domain-containing protein [Lactarius deliciosus]|nr:integral peroxisomal membrane peroxin-domain-containing protein [Lactarius deliciosus]
MAVFEYVDIPASATLLPSDLNHHADIKIQPSFPPTSHAAAPDGQTSPSSAQRTVFGNLPSLLLASSLQISTVHSPENPRNVSQLMSTRDPLSVPTTTINFRRFISKIGPVFWLQDRIEEIITWRKGWKVTALWMAVYSFLCYYPRLILLLPNAVILAIIIVSHPQRANPGTDSFIIEEIQPPPRAQAREGSAEWLANIQGIQNLMGTVADLHDAGFPYLLHLMFATPYTPYIFSIIFLSTILALPFLSFVPLRPLFLIGGLVPFAVTHPFIQRTFSLIFSTLPLRYCRTRLVRLIDNDGLKDRHWRSELREVELFENERWVPGEGTGWSKTNLKTGERVAWTRGRDGWSGITADGGGDVSSNLTFLLEPGWLFIETEDWRADVEAKWSQGGADDSGWVYTNDAWLEPHASPVTEWKTQGSMTRRRRWTRRIYLDPKASAIS